jgi:hypothetical protein
MTYPLLHFIVEHICHHIISRMEDGIGSNKVDRFGTYRSALIPGKKIIHDYNSR